MKKIIFLAFMPFFILADFEQNQEVLESQLIEELYTKATAPAQTSIPTPTKPADTQALFGQMNKSITITKPIIIDSMRMSIINYKPIPNYWCSLITQ